VGAYYSALSEAFGIRIDAEGPGFGSEVLLDELAESAELATFVGEGSRYLWPESYELRRIPVVDPRPVSPRAPSSGVPTTSTPRCWGFSTTSARCGG
jgi:hypothetical protein